MKREFTKYIKSLSEVELVKELQRLYTKFPAIKKYYEMELSPNTDKIVAEYKTKIKKEYFRKASYGRGRSSVTRKVITDFKKISIYPSDVIELWVFRTEMMVKYVIEQDYYSESLFKSIVTSFETTCKLIVKERMEKEFRNRCHEIVTLTNEFWDLSEEIEWIYEQYFGAFVR